MKAGKTYQPEEFVVTAIDQVEKTANSDEDYVAKIFQAEWLKFKDDFGEHLQKLKTTE